MGWKDLEFREQLSAVMSGIQSTATFGMLLVAIIGIWKVTPIITYQVEKQASDLSQIAVEPHTHPLVIDALSWWGSHMQSYDRLIEILDEAEDGRKEVSFEVLAEAGMEIVPGISPDLLVLRATDAAGKQELVSVPVNRNAMAPSQYIRFKINQGAFEDLPDPQRQGVENAVERYMHRVMVPMVPPLIVRPDMSLDELRLEIALSEHHRDEALRHIKVLEEVVTAALRTT